MEGLGSSEIVRNGEVVAKIKMLDSESLKGAYYYRSVCVWPGGEDEEIDCTAYNNQDAREVIELELRTNYIIGGKIKEMERCDSAPIKIWGFN